MFAPYRSTNLKYNVSTHQTLKESEYISRLEKKLEEKQNFTTETSDLRFLKFSERVSPDKNNYAKDLQLQVQEKLKKNEIEKLEKYKPAISEEFHGYPNRPQTPKQLRRQNELEKMKKVKQDLEDQINLKSSQKKYQKFMEIENERKKNSEMMKKVQEENQEKIQIKHLEREILNDAWQKAQKTKEIKKQIENIEHKGINPRSRSVFTKEEEISPERNKPNIENAISSDNLSLIETKKTNYLVRAARLKEELQKRYENSYQFKIKRIMEDAKSSRNIVTKSLSPTYFANKKKFLLNNRLSDLKKS